MGICFVGKKKAAGRRGFQEFISEYIEDKPGEIVDIDTGKDGPFNLVFLFELAIFV